MQLSVNAAVGRLRKCRPCAVLNVHLPRSHLRRFVPDVHAALAAFVRVLKPGGTLVVTVAQPPDVQPFWSFLSELAEGGCCHRHGWLGSACYAAKPAVEALACTCGHSTP